MADEDKPLEPGDKKVEVEAKATVSDDEGKPTHEVEVEADAVVRDLREKRDEKEAAEEDPDAVTIIAGGTRIRIDNKIDVDDPEAHRVASHAADRPTAKAAAATPRSFASSGRPD